MEFKGSSESPIVYYSHTMGPDCSSVEYQMNQARYRTLYTQTESNPHNASLWDTIISLAENEEKIAASPYLPTVPLNEMIAVGRLLQQATSQNERYQLLLQECSNGETWYDIIHRKENDMMLEPVFPLLKREIQKQGKKYERVLDIGTGSGNVAEKLVPYCDSVVGIDILHEALEKAKKREDIGAPMFTQGNATDLPFQGESFDLVISNGLTVYLPRKEEWKQNNEIQRVLKPGGLYVSIWAEQKGDINKMEFVGAKELLANSMSWMIVDGAPDPSDQMGFREIREQFISKGFQEVASPMKGKNFVVGFRKT